MRERERTTDSERHIQYGRRWTQIRNYRLLPRGHQRNIGRKPTNGIVGLAGHRTGRALARRKRISDDSNSVHDKTIHQTNQRNSFSDNRAIHLSGWHKWSSFKSERTCVFSSAAADAALLGDRVHAISPAMSICNDKTLTQCAAFTGNDISNSKESVTTGNCSPCRSV